MADVLGQFETNAGVVPVLRRPRPTISIDPGIRGGRPLVAGTRVPFELVASLVRDGVAPTDISANYSSVTESAARDGADFSDYVDGFSLRPSHAA